jgi:hypothetical protein
LNNSASIDDYKHNMAWPTNGNCPSGFTHVPHLFYEVYWNTPLFASRWTQGQGTQPFVLANGDPTGYSLHADFIAGWDTGTLTQIINNCDTGDGAIDTCPGLIGGLNDPSTSCNIPSAVDEVITGTLSALPGNNPVVGWGKTAGGGGASAPTATQPASPPQQTTSSASEPSGTSSVATGWKYYGCYADTNARVLTGVEFVNLGQGQVTNTACVS